jgi:hypothetical protein
MRIIDPFPWGVFEGDPFGAPGHRSPDTIAGGNLYAEIHPVFMV